MRNLIAGVVVVAAALATFTPAVHTISAHADTHTTVVLTFDDDRADQMTAASLLQSNGMVGTFYINSNTVGDSGHMTWSQIQGLESDGNEIGGHTLDFPHEDLTQVSTNEATRQVCDDKDAIESHGFTLDDFAYPFGAGWDSATVRSIVQACGYSSARRASGLSGGTPADASPPADIWAIKTQALPVAATSLATLQGWVTSAENNGGTVTIVFHESVTAMPQFLSWLSDRAASGTVTATMSEALGNSTPSDTTAPSSSIACSGSSCSSGTYYSTSMHVSLSASDNVGGSGLEGIYYTTDGSTPTQSNQDEYTGSFTLSSSKVVKYRAYDNGGNAESTHSQTINIDSTAPSSSIKCNGSTCTSAWHSAGEQISLSANDSGSGVASIRYTTDGSTPSKSSAAYSGAFTLSSTKTVKFRAYDNVGNAESTHSQTIDIDTVGPVAAIKCKNAACSSGWYGGAVPVELSATDGGSGVAAIHYTTDGSTPTLASPVYSAPFTVATSTHVNARAVDLVGNVGAVKSALVRIDKVDPKVTIASPGKGASVTKNVKVTVHASDNSSGVVKVNFVVDGKFVSADTKKPFAFVWNTSTVAKGKHTLTAKAFDAAGNVSAASIKVNVR